jgi:hypothetical protein
VLVDNLRRNFARLGSIHVTVDGQLPGEPRFGEIDR